MITHNLFVYGTLRVPEILRRVIGCTLAGRDAWLDGYVNLEIEGALYPGITAFPNCVTRGISYVGITPKMLAALDEYEGEMYERRPLVIRYADSRSDLADAYVVRDSHLDMLSDREWDYEDFFLNKKEIYLTEMFYCHSRGT